MKTFSEYRYRLYRNSGPTGTSVRSPGTQVTSVLAIALAALLLCGVPAAPLYAQVDPGEQQAGGAAAEAMEPVAPRGWLGAGVQDLTTQLAATLGRPPAKGALVVQVVDDAPAAKAGLADGDLIVAVDGKEIGPARELVEAMARLAPGAETRLTIVRDGVEQTVRVIIEQRPPDAGVQQGHAGAQEGVCTAVRGGGTAPRCCG